MTQSTVYARPDLHRVKIKSDIIRCVLLHLRLSPHLVELCNPVVSTLLLNQLPAVLLARLLGHKWRCCIVACVHQLIYVSEERLDKVILRLGASSCPWSLGDIFEPRGLKLMDPSSSCLVMLLLFRDTAFLRVVRGLWGLKVVYVIDIAQGLLLHLDRIDNSLSDDLFLLLWLRFDIETFSLREV